MAGAPHRDDGACGEDVVTNPGIVADAADGSHDATVSVDAPPAACAPGCAASCENGVCVFRCMTPGSCNQTVFCPATGPCTVVCGGADSCHNGVRCGLGACNVSCSGNKSCNKRARCELSCACDVTCEGNDSCKEHAWCQDDECDTGDGCTSAAPGCNAC